MIAVTRLDGTPLIVNCEQIAWIEFQPDTVVSLMNGEKLLVRERPEVVVERVQEYKRLVLGVTRRRTLRLVEWPRPRHAGEGL